MITLCDHLPKAALCDHPKAALAQDLEGSAVFWWAGEDLKADTAGAITTWPARIGPRAAIPTAPATGNARVGEADDLIGLHCRAGGHCGMRVDDVVSQVSTLSLAVRYLVPPGASGKTLVTLNATDEAPKNYLFASETDGLLSVQDNQGHAALSLDLPPRDDARMVLISLTPHALRAEILGGPSAITPAPPDLLQGTASLFIGCRNNRAGLLKTLGSALITDVWLWPGTDIWQDPQSLRALRRFHLWSEGGA